MSVYTTHKYHSAENVRSANHLMKNEIGDDSTKRLTLPINKSFPKN